MMGIFTSPTIASTAAALAMGPEDPDAGVSDADGCIYVVNAGGGTVNRVCFDAAKSVTGNTTVVTLNAGAGVNNILGIVVEAAASKCVASQIRNAADDFVGRENPRARRA